MLKTIGIKLMCMEHKSTVFTNQDERKEERGMKGEEGGRGGRERREGEEGGRGGRERREEDVLRRKKEVKSSH